MFEFCSDIFATLLPCEVSGWTLRRGSPKEKRAEIGGFSVRDFPPGEAGATTLC